MKGSPLTRQIIEIINSIPYGKVSTYGNIAAAAGNPRAARQVVRVLHTFSESEDLPWWRVVNREGRIALKRGFGFEEQFDLLISEGIELTSAGCANLDRYGWDVDDGISGNKE